MVTTMMMTVTVVVVVFCPMQATAITLLHTSDGNARKIVVLLFNPIYYGFEPRLIGRCCCCRALILTRPFAFIIITAGCFTYFGPVVLHILSTIIAIVIAVS